MCVCNTANDCHSIYTEFGDNCALERSFPFDPRLNMCSVLWVSIGASSCFVLDQIQGFSVFFLILIKLLEFIHEFLTFLLNFAVWVQEKFQCREVVDQFLDWFRVRINVESRAVSWNGSFEASIRSKPDNDWGSIPAPELGFFLSSRTRVSSMATNKFASVLGPICIRDKFQGWYWFVISSRMGSGSRTDMYSEQVPRTVLICNQFQYWFGISWYCYT